MKRKISIATGLLQQKYGEKEALRIAKEIGVDMVDFELFRYSKADKNNIYSKASYIL